MTPAERLRKHQRALEKTQRELDRERTKLENQEKKLVQDIKKNAKNGQMGAVKIQAKDLVRTRRYCPPIHHRDIFKNSHITYHPVSKIYSEVLPDENTAASNIPSYTGKSDQAAVIHIG